MKLQTDPRVGYLKSVIYMKNDFTRSLQGITNIRFLDFHKCQNNDK